MPIQSGTTNTVKKFQRRGVVTPNFIIQLKGITDKTGILKGFEDFAECPGFQYSAERELADRQLQKGDVSIQNTDESPLVFAISLTFQPFIEEYFYTGKEIEDIQIQKFSYQSSKAQAGLQIMFYNCRILSYEVTIDRNVEYLEVICVYTDHLVQTKGLKQSGDAEGVIHAYDTKSRGYENYKA